MAPVGSYEALAAAIQAGADSVYFGVGKLNMRSASAANFTLDDLAKIVATAHAAGVKAYLTVNTIVYEDEMQTVHEVIDRAKAEGIDAIIATDFAAILYARRIGVEVHISTQSNISNSETVKFFSQWADTVVLARELTLEQVAQIHRQIVENDIRGPRGELVEIEMFAHGALCMSISGKCYLSLYETNCSANRGACRQLCRRKYTVTDTETGAALDIDGRYVLSPKDLCTVDFLDRFIGSGVRVLKIEGRARGAEYVKRVVECYDEALRAIEAGRYYEIPSMPYNWLSNPPSLNMLLGVWWLGNLLYPQYYAYDMVEKTQEMFRLLWNYDLTAEDARAMLANSTLKGAS